MKLALLSLLFLICGAIIAEEDLHLDDLASKDITKQITRLVALAEKGTGARSAEPQIAALLTKTLRGRWLSRWTFSTLSSIGASPFKYVEKFRDAALWKPEKSLAPAKIEGMQDGNGDIIGVGGPGTADPADVAEPEYPAEIKAKSDHAWHGCVRALARICVSKQPERAWDAQVCLQGMGSPAEIAVSELCDAIQNEELSAMARAHATKLVGFFGPSKQASTVLLKAIENTDPRIRAEAAASLGRLCEPYPERAGVPKPEPHPNRDKAVQALIKSLSDPEPDVRISAACGLGYMVDQAKEALDPLKQALDKEDNAKAQQWLRQTIRYIEDGRR
jgi:hypothetical protein